MINQEQKLLTLLDYEGFIHSLEFGEHYIWEGIVPAICCNPKNPDCNYTEGMEPDQKRGWCPECEANTLVSGLILMGVI